jgi:hypothetical protein
VTTESSEIGLAGHADGGGVRDVVGTVGRATIIAWYCRVNTQSGTKKNWYEIGTNIQLAS